MAEIRANQQEDEVRRGMADLSFSARNSEAVLASPELTDYQMGTCLLRGVRLVIPSRMRLEMLDKLHEGHQGVVKCR